MSIVGRFMVTITGKNQDAMADLVRKHGISVVRQTGQQLYDKTGFTVDAIIGSDQIKALEKEGYRVKVREDLEKIQKARQAEVGKGDRYQRKMK
jgi:carboxypeptidase T